MKPLITVCVVAGAAAVGFVTLASLTSVPVRARATSSSLHQPFDSASIDRDIASNERAVRLDPNAALNWSYVCSAYMTRSRESDDYYAAIKAERAARRSLKIRLLGNVGARNKLVSALLQEHRFRDALAECEKAERAGIYSDDTALLRIESLIELGRYAEARKLQKTKPQVTANAAGYAVLARLCDVEGKTETALTYYRRATEEVDRNAGMPSNAVAWFHTRLAMQLAKTRRHDAARLEYGRALELYPNDYKAMAGLARLATQDGRWQEAIDWGSRSDRIAQMADIRALVGDAYAMLGNQAQAEEQFRRVAELVGRPSGISDGLHEAGPPPGAHAHRLDRQYALFCADHGRDPEGAYAAALRDFQAREDLYSYDTLAWVCLKRGDAAEAAKAISRALTTGTRDPMVLYHAGMICEATGRVSMARTLLSDALEIDPHFDGIAAPRARALVAKLSQAERPA
ncbi:MAG TPA: tetratricopeptide repeat protein [Fimbriimonadaceae bacterium]|nr:tetratricopeptide repeat protein [Fimbriimonadaceae bacterium]